jgi:glycosyltransferase involved in cell wall biosynthesis
VARLVPQKAPDDFVATCAQISRRRPDAHYLLIGSGVMHGELDRMVADLGLTGRWHHLPHLEDAASVLGQLDVFVLTSRFEGGPYTPLEAMREGVPVVLTDVVGNRDVVDTGVSGVLRPFGDTEGLAQAVVELLDDPAGRQAMVAAARCRLAERFDVRLMGEALGELYAELTTGSGSRRRTRRLPQPRWVSSTQSLDSRAEQ